MIKLLIFVVLLLIDVVSKRLIFHYIDLHNFINIFIFLDITHIHNFGISFGLLSGFVESWVLVIIGLLIVGFIFYLMISSTDAREKIGLFFIISGAFSNIIDRTYNGYVIDFIYLHYGNLYWPAFNFADIYITIGIIVLILSIFNKKILTK